ncbi:unnamed protein product [Vitrella brassicaformis CCMP3155]|uniref:Uncharacterized protein n=1 Tax=Vitrella brassicaformis (strain CCMP3155) TaxID=1169540 RepID=A0A0G4H5S9_VITBC|nr:unnamed protein product [Vitrella brassicaformis CCMP3155]|eukprot:CEM39198.1 unnamed protein product [Vitrella brassicaformis CCMP3155]
MSDAVPDELWRRRILPSLLVHEVVCVRATCRAKSALVTAGVLVERIDGSLARLTLTGLIDIDRTGPPLIHLCAGGGLCAGAGQQPGLAGLPLVLSAQWLMANLPSKTAFHQLPLAMAIYRLFGHMLTYRGQSLAVQQAGNGAYRIGNVSFRVVPLSELPVNHDYTDGYQTTDPVIRHDTCLYRSFSSSLVESLFIEWGYEEGVGVRWVLQARINQNDPRYRPLLTVAISEQQGGIAVDYRYDRGNLNANPADCRYVLVSGFRPDEVVAAHLSVYGGYIYLHTTEPSAANRPHPLADRYPVSMPR